MLDQIMEKMMPAATAISTNKFLIAIRDGFMVAFPATMFASIAMIIQNMPATFGFSGFLPKAVQTFLDGFFGPIGNATMTVSALFVVFGVAYHLAGKLNCTKI